MLNCLEQTVLGGVATETQVYTCTKSLQNTTEISEFDQWLGGDFYFRQ